MRYSPFYGIKIFIFIEKVYVLYYAEYNSLVKHFTFTIIDIILICYIYKNTHFKKNRMSNVS